MREGMEGPREKGPSQDSKHGSRSLPLSVRMDPPHTGRGDVVK